MLTLEALRSRRTEILALAEKCAVENVRVFGSVARGDATDESDVDFLVLPLTQKRPFGMFEFKEELASLLQHDVDVVSERGLYWYIRDDILQEAVTL